MPGLGSSVQSDGSNRTRGNLSREAKIMPATVIERLDERVNLSCSLEFGWGKLRLSHKPPQKILMNIPPEAAICTVYKNKFGGTHVVFEIDDPWF